MLKLPVEFKDKWTWALRSGDYKQGSGYLRAGEGFCCLGVACDIQQGRGAWKTLAGDMEIYETECNSTSYPDMDDLPVDIWNALQQQSPVPSSVEGTCSVMNYLADMNDGGKDFDTIAAWIEENL